MEKKCNNEANNHVKTKSNVILFQAESPRLKYKILEIRRSYALDYTFDHSQLKPNLSDFMFVEKNPKARFPHKFMVFNGNNGTILSDVIRYRGFSRVC